MKLIFVYNAVSGSTNALLDVVHKVVSPSTYTCNLCDITFEIISEKKEWKDFREASNIEMVFLHKDEFLKQYRSKWLPKYVFPIVLSEENYGLEIYITPEVINNLEDSKALIQEIAKRR
ncbi:MAG: hypothetical protein ACI86C_001522 [Candidatus Latescibacterota bacterium]